MAGSDVTFNWRTTGFSGVDERNGVSTGSLVLICGDTGTGKSTAAHSIGVHQYKKYGDGVFYVSWEQGKKEIMSRIFSHESDVDLGKIIDDELTPEERYTVRKAKLQLLFEVGDTNLDEYLTAGEETAEEEFIQQASQDFTSKPSGFYIYDNLRDFDDLMLRMELLRSTKNVRLFIVDYLTLIPPGTEHRGLQSWEVYIKMSQRLKTFARINDVIVITPLQFDAKDEKIRFSKNIINDSDLALFLSQDKEDKEMDSVTWRFGKYRNFKTIPNKPLQDFKLMRAFDRAKFLELEF
jgi:replicative DNA helicase